MNDMKYKYIKIYLEKSNLRQGCAVIELDFDNQESMNELPDIFDDSHYDYFIDADAYQVKYRRKGSTGDWTEANEGYFICRESEDSIFTTNRDYLKYYYVDSKYADNSADKCLLLEFFRYLEKKRHYRRISPI